MELLLTVVHYIVSYIIATSSGSSVVLTTQLRIRFLSKSCQPFFVEQKIKNDFELKISTYLMYICFQFLFGLTGSYLL